MKISILLVAAGVVVASVATIVLLLPSPDENVLFGGGEGTVDEPYVVETLEHLQNMVYRLNSHFVLAGDIDASATTGWNGNQGFVPVGNHTDKFLGSFDGRNYTITGAYINRPSTSFVGIFGYVGDVGMVKNLVLKHVNVTGEFYVGGLVGSNNGTISNSYVLGLVEGRAMYGGGLIGYNGGSVNHCGASGDLSGYWFAGGLVGYNEGTVGKSYATMNTTGDDRIGGLVGWNNGTINETYSKGKVFAIETGGGLVGSNHGMVVNSYSTGEVRGGKESGHNGGLVGSTSGIVINSYCTGNTTGSGPSVGGFAGTRGGQVNNSYWNNQTTEAKTGVGWGSTEGVYGKTTEEMKTQSTFVGW
ncbi:MAG: peptidase A26, partial [Candidatus Thermoplasmatota archaeon]|nr:peptidase A26 [Candidatus Thermoplasmatota archaeon]